jgi:hypothetical protein
MCHILCSLTRRDIIINREEKSCGVCDDGGRYGVGVWRGHYLSAVVPIGLLATTPNSRTKRLGDDSIDYGIQSTEHEDSIPMLDRKRTW